MLTRLRSRAQALPEDVWELHVDPRESERRKRERIVRLNTVIVPKLRALGFGLVSLTVLLHNYFVFESVDVPAWVRLNVVLALYSAVSWYLLQLFYADLQKSFDLGVAFLVLDLAFYGLAIHASGGEKSWLFFLAVFRVVDQTPLSQRRALAFAHVAPLSYLGVLLYVLFVEGRSIPLGPELAKLIVIYTGGLYASVVARNADRRTRGMARVIRFSRKLVAELAQKSTALESSSRELRESLDGQSRLAGENAALYAAAQRDHTRQQQIFNSTSDGIIFVTRDGRVEAANVRAGDLLDFDPQSVIGVELARLVSRLYSVSAGDSFLPRLQDLLENAWAGGHGDLQQPATGRILHWIAQPARDSNGEILGLTFTFQDVTRARELARELEDKSQLLEDARLRAEDANRAKGEFLANVSHEIRTPLSAIISIAQHLEDSGARGDMVGRIRSSAESLMTIIDDILDFSRIESRKLALDQSPFSLRATLQDAVETLRVQASEKRLGLHLEVSDEAPDDLVGDALRLRQVLVNLLGNAVKFTERGEVRLRVSVAAARPDDVVLHFGVTDTGIGIPRDKQDVVFEAFAQADGSAGRRYGGTGLGLSISTRLVKMMRGDLWVESEAGEGATFRFTATFGLRSALDVSAPAAPADAAGAVSPLVVLVAEDDDVHRELLTAMLTASGHRVIAARDGRDALLALARERVDVALFAVQMPGVDGFQATVTIRAWERTSGGHLPIVGMTASALSNAADRAQQVGMNRLVVKPLARTRLYEVLEEQRQQSSPSPLPRELAGRADFLAGLGDDVTLARKLVDIFLEESPRLLDRVRTSVAGGDAETLTRAAHALKGTISNFPAGEARSVAARMEEHGAAGDLAAARELLPSLEAELLILRTVLPALL